MKKILILILGAFVALPAICQTPLNDIVGFPDTTNMEKRFVFSYPKPFAPQGEIRSDLFKVKWGKVVDLFLNTGGLINYQPESDQGTSAHHKTMIRILAEHIPMNADIKPEELLLVQTLIAEVVKPGVYVPPTTGTPVPDIEVDIDDTPSPENAYMLNATTPSVGVVNQPDWTKWVHFKNNPWNSNHLNNSASFGYAVNSYLQVIWTGHKIEWRAEKRVNHGIAAVSVDGGPEQMIDLYKNTQDNGSEIVFTWPLTQPANPVNANHTIKIRVTGNKNAAATEFNVSHDYFKVYKRP